MSDPSLADWIEAHCSFPNSMVDCIVPATGPRERELVHEIGIDDAVPVTHERFRQWVIEDDFVGVVDVLTLELAAPANKPKNSS